MSGNRERVTLVREGPLGKSLQRCNICGSLDWIFVSNNSGYEQAIFVYKCAHCNGHKALFYRTEDVERAEYFRKQRET